MKQWFGRMDKSGTEYNPHIITEAALMCDVYGKNHMNCRKCCKCSSEDCGDCNGVDTNVSCSGGGMHAGGDYGFEDHLGHSDQGYLDREADKLGAEHGHESDEMSLKTRARMARGTRKYDERNRG